MWGGVGLPSVSLLFCMRFGCLQLPGSIIGTSRIGRSRHRDRRSLFSPFWGLLQSRGELCGGQAITVIIIGIQICQLIPILLGGEGFGGLM